MNESDMNYFTIPAEYEYSIVMAHLVKYLCVETYDEVAGISFTRKYFPKMFFLTGEWEYRNNGTIILGTAEGGKKIFLAGINLLKETLEEGYGDFYGNPEESLNHYFIKTIHHEFTHILNQNKDYPVEFKSITGTGYVADSWNEEPYESHHLEYGFITDSARGGRRRRPVPRSQARHRPRLSPERLFHRPGPAPRHRSPAAGRRLLRESRPA